MRCKSESHSCSASKLHFTSNCIKILSWLMGGSPQILKPKHFPRTYYFVRCCTPIINSNKTWRGTEWNFVKTVVVLFSALRFSIICIIIRSSPFDGSGNEIANNLKSYLEKIALNLGVFYNLNISFGRKSL